MLRSVQFLAAAGFKQMGKRFESELRIDNFDEAPFAAVFERVAAAGITLSTFDQEVAPHAEERLYELAHALLLSVPFPGGAVFDIPFDDWKRDTFEHPNASREATVVAKRDDEYVGYSSLWLPKQGVPVTLMTGVAPAERRRGIALALKLMTIRIARSRGFAVMRTTNDTANPGILALNKRLGYQPLPAWLAWEKQLRAK